MDDVLLRLRDAFLADAASAFRDWYRLQGDLAEAGDERLSRALTRDLLEHLPELTFASHEARARFLYNLAVFLGSAGPSAELARALGLFDEALLVYTEGDEHARTLHARANALSALGTEAAQLREAVDCYRRALAWRTGERAIARGVSLHNLGVALRRLAELEPRAALEHLEAGAAALREAIAIREAHELRDGQALSWFQLGLTLRAAGSTEATPAFETAAACYQSAGKADEAALARRLAADLL